MLKEIKTVEEMAALPSYTTIVNRFFIDRWKETRFSLQIWDGAPILRGRLGTRHRVQASDFRTTDRYFAEVSA